MKQDKCAVCGTTKNLEHHHIISKADGGTDDETNFLTLCSKHHAAIHGIELTRRRGGWGSPNRILKGQYSNSHLKRGSNGRFVKGEKLKSRKLICLHEHEWEFIDKVKRKYKCGRGGFISILLEKYMNEIDLEIIR
tara:strand:- start:26 stop:433 length:408 start_codon:yes stop_codon:yes gene_type:complete